MRRFSTIFSARAARESDAARTWLAEHEGADGVELLNAEVRAALDRLEVLPEMGAPARVRLGATTTRRIVLERSGYHLYYRAHLKTRLIEVVCLWHERRRPPRSV
jgi:plasmid stabilization system protein ParE